MFCFSQEKLEVVGRFEEKVKKIEDFCGALNEFDKTIKVIDAWMKDADGQVSNSIWECFEIQSESTQDTFL